MKRHTYRIDLATTAVEETEEGRDREPKPAPHLTGEEVGGQKDVEVDTDELLPRHSLFALRGWWKAVAFENVAYRLVTDRIAQVGQGTHDTVVPPRTILAGHPYHQVFELFLDARTANRHLGLGIITLLVSKRAVPSQDGVGLGNGCHLFESLFAQLLAHHGECFALTRRELHPALNLLAEDPIFAHQVRVA
jgi:hypothetical protein